MAAHQSAQVRAHPDQGERGVGRVVHPAEQSLACRLDRVEELDQLLLASGSAVVGLVPAVEGGADPVGVDAVVLDDVGEEGRPAGVVELVVGGQGPRRDRADGGLAHVAHEDLAVGEQAVQGGRPRRIGRLGTTVVPLFRRSDRTGLARSVGPHLRSLSNIHHLG